MTTTDPSLADRPETWPVVSTRQIHRDRWVVGVREDVVRDGDATFKRLVVEHPGAAIVLAIDDDERVCLLRQYRHAVGQRLIELPAGVCDVEGEEPLETAKRELREEAELEAEHWQLLLSVYSTPGICQERQHIFLATGLTAASRGGFELRHEEASLELFWAPFDDLLQAVLDGAVKDAPMVAGVLAYDVLRRRA